MQWTKVKQSIPIVGIILLSAVFRFVYLDRIPTAVSGDELLYAITAKSIYLTGHDITGTWNPLSVFLFRYPPNEQQAELPYFIHLLFSAPFPFSLFLAKLPFALLSVGIVLLLYGIAKKLFRKSVAVATGLIAAVNPWLVVMGRTGYESTPTTFFYLLAIWTLLSANSWGILWSLIPFMLAFYSYIGTKLIFIPFIILAVILTYRKQKQYAFRPYFILILSCIVFTAGYLILLKTSSTGSRISELLLPSSTAVAAQVNEIRKISIQSPLLPFLVNKYTAFFQIIFSKLFRIFSPTYLFLEGDQFFLPVRQSFFYYVDFLFMIWGALSLFNKKRKYFIILTGFILIGTLPHLLHVTMGDFSGHLALMFPFMVLLIGAGVADCIDHLRGRLRPIALGFISLIYDLFFPVSAHRVFRLSDAPTLQVRYPCPTDPNSYYCVLDTKR
jgi:4-amino-4-deoxy-L-arabinose transferase-like glycosyltransferase